MRSIQVSSLKGDKALEETLKQRRNKLKEGETEN